MDTLARLQEMQEVTEKLAATNDLDEAKVHMSRLVVLMSEEFVRTNGIADVMNKQLYEIQNLRSFIEKEGLALKYELHKKREVR
ncbi:hypothetical protein AT268_26810 [Bacillus cereus]|uniref:Uncharacterized protein n=1 Tax=Bacillus cereus TaxID=1396 RepID=A0A9X0MHP8_BACCE|nr:hypothetical protein [Bacillus cereus]KXY45048.1 hypothetical protein AT268_26810 [Bacillus cereus]